MSNLDHQSRSSIILMDMGNDKN